MGYRSPNAARDHLLALERKGAIEVEFGASRAIRLTNPGGVPVIGPSNYSPLVGFAALTPPKC